MPILRQCCCGVSLRKGSLAICYWIMFWEIVYVCLLLSAADNQPTRSILLRSQSNAYFELWSSIFNIFVIGTALYGVYKQKAHLLIMFLSYQTVMIIFSVFNLFKLRPLANDLNEAMENSLNNERDQTFDTFPAVLCLMVALLGRDVYFLLVVLSYGQSLMMSTTMVAVAVPVVAYTTTSGSVSLDGMYSQPATNPYLIADGKTPPQQQQQQHEPYAAAYGYPYYGPSYGGHSSLTNLPPPYRP